MSLSIFVGACLRPGVVVEVYCVEVLFFLVNCMVFFFTIFTQGQGGGAVSSLRLQSEERSKSKGMFSPSEFLNTAIFGEVTCVETLSTCTLPPPGGCSVGSPGTMSLAATAPPAGSLCFALPSHSDNRVSHVLLPILPFTWLLFLHWTSLD